MPPDGGLACGAGGADCILIDIATLAPYVQIVSRVLDRIRMPPALACPSIDVSAKAHQPDRGDYH